MKKKTNRQKQGENKATWFSSSGTGACSKPYKRKERRKNAEKKQTGKNKEKIKQPGSHLLALELVANRVKEALATRDQGKEPVKR